MNPFEMEELPIQIVQGSTFVLPITYRDFKTGDVIDLSGYTAKMQVRQTPEASEEPDIELTTENGGIELEGISGSVIIKILSAATLALDSHYKGTWNLFLIPIESTAFCLLGGTFEVTPSTTRLAEDET